MDKKENSISINCSMKDVRAVQMQMVKELLRVCEKHSLNVWAESGTLLGAVRHKGFIPWDDDIDMAMMRDDYERLVRIAPCEFHHPFFFQCAWTEKHPYTHGHAQLRMNSTSAILPSDSRMKFHQGVFIDIFVYDAIPDDEAELRPFLNDISKACKTVNRWNKPIVISLKPKTIFKAIMDLIYRPTHSFIDAYNAFNSTLSKYKIDDNTYIVKLGLIHNYNYVSKKKLDKHLFDHTVMLPFEDIMIPAPECYDEVLSTLYGKDYMTPLKAPTLHGAIAALDTNNSYIDYLSIVRKQKRKEVWKEIFHIASR